jgi:pimeloyl-ACP methyl ester carboxylesterase
MLGAFLDRWDERQAAGDDGNRPAETMTLDTSLAFRGTDEPASYETLSTLVQNGIANATHFYAAAPRDVSEFSLDGDILRFRSAIATETESNNIVYARVYEAKKRRGAVIILPHWNSALWGYQTFSRHLMRLGLTAVELTLPYHGCRNKAGGIFSDYFLSANVGRTIRSVRQGVLDAKGVLDWLNLRGYQKFGLIGLSLGSCVAGLVAAHDDRVRASALLLTAGDFSEVVWTGRATRHIRAALAAGLTLDQLQRVWSIVSTGTFTRELSRAGHRSLIISGSRDRVVLPRLTARFVEQLRSHEGDYLWRILPCGHYSLGMLPFNIISFAMLLRFFGRDGFFR